jgi:hypothetical protein
MSAIASANTPTCTHYYAPPGSNSGSDGHRAGEGSARPVPLFVPQPHPIIHIDYSTPVMSTAAYIEYCRLDCLSTVLALGSTFTSMRQRRAGGGVGGGRAASTPHLPRHLRGRAADGLCGYTRAHCYSPLKFVAPMGIPHTKENSEA